MQVTRDPPSEHGTHRRGRTAGFVYQSVLRPELARRLGISFEPALNGCRSRLHHIGIGRSHKHTRVLVLVADRDVRIITQDGDLLRHLTLDYQPIKPTE